MTDRAGYGDLGEDVGMAEDVCHNTDQRAGGDAMKRDLDLGADNASEPFDAFIRAGDDVRRVCVNERGEVTVDGRVIAGSGPWSLRAQRIIAKVRQGTPSEWWLWAAEVDEAVFDAPTGGPLGVGVDFFASEMASAVPPEVRAEIQEQAYDAAREAIVQGLDNHLRTVLRVAAVIP